MTRRFVTDLFEWGAAQQKAPAPRRAETPSGNSGSDPVKAPLTVSQAVRAIRRSLETSFAELVVEGEVSSLRRPASGHWYFTLKDERCQLPTVMFARDNRRLPFTLTEGMAVVARGRVTYYEPGGRTQLVAQHLEPSGLGARALALKQLAERLTREGLFAEARKRPLPGLPRRVGVVTSISGAALRDIMQVAQRRFPELPMVVSPTRVQGAGADAEIVAALERLDRSRLCDVIIVGRGGGSFEDLEVFSSEQVIRAVAACQTPVVSAVGHEVDVALCDLAADVRAPTPSAAAELVVPERTAVELALRRPMERGAQLLRRQVTGGRLRLEALRGALSDPKLVVLSHRQDLDRLHHRASRALAQQLAARRELLDGAGARLAAASPAQWLTRQRSALDVLALRQRSSLARQVASARARLEAAVAELDALSPLAVLSRGYAICLAQGRAVRRAGALSRGDRVDVRLAEGRFEADVHQVHADPDPPGLDRHLTGAQSDS